MILVLNKYFVTKHYGVLTVIVSQGAFCQICQPLSISAYQSVQFIPDTKESSLSSSLIANGTNKKSL